MAITKLLSCIKSCNFDNGGWLPSGKEMASEFNVSYLTCFRAIKFLEAEGLLVGHRSKGFYVTPKDMRHRKIAVIYQNGEYSPFIRTGFEAETSRHNCDLTAAIDYISHQGFYTQLIQASNPDKICDLVKSYNAYGAVWLYPTEKSLDEIKRLAKNIPLMIACAQFKSDSSSVCEADYDLKDIARDKLQILLNRGHKSILYVGHYQGAKDARIDQIINEHEGHFGEENCINNLFINGSKLQAKIEELRATAIFSLTTEIEEAYLLRHLCQISPENQPEILIEHSTERKLGNNFSPAKPVYINRRIDCLPGYEAARILIRHLLYAEPLESKKISYY